MFTLCKLSRNIVEVSGKDAHSFLQGLITQDINLTSSQAIYSTMLNAKGRYLFDFFIIKHANNFLIDIHSEDSLLLIKKLTLYKLRADITFKLLEDFSVYSLFNESLPHTALFNLTGLGNTIVKENNVIYIDPRLESLGSRIITKNIQDFSIDIKPQIQDTQQYTYFRYKKGVIEAPELKKEIIPMEYGFDELNALSYTKGCYLGQEFTNSAKRRLAIRKRLVVATFRLTPSTKILVADKVIYKPAKELENKNQESEETFLVVGEVITLLQNTALILLKMQYLKEELFINNIPLIVEKPHFVTHYVTE